MNSHSKRGGLAESRQSVPTSFIMIVVVEFVWPRGVIDRDAGIEAPYPCPVLAAGCPQHIKMEAGRGSLLVGRSNVHAAAAEQTQNT
jgi:hypothetical protein